MGFWNMTRNPTSYSHLDSQPRSYIQDCGNGRQCRYTADFSHMVPRHGSEDLLSTTTYPTCWPTCPNDGGGRACPLSPMTGGLVC